MKRILLSRVLLLAILLVYGLLLASSWALAEFHIHAEFDICDRFVRPTPEQLYDGIILNVGTGNIKGLQFSVPPKCSVRFNDLSRADEAYRTDLSVYTPPAKRVYDVDFNTCLHLRIEERSERPDPIPCNTPTPQPKILASGTDWQSLTLTIFEPIAKNQRPFQLFIQNSPIQPERETIYSISNVTFKCIHPNPYILPSVYHGDHLFHHSHLHDRAFLFTSEPGDHQKDSGEYKCNWEGVGVSPVTTKVVNVVLYAPEIDVTVFKRNATGVFNIQYSVIGY